MNDAVAEGMQLDVMPEDCISSMNPEKYTEMVVRIYTDQRLWQTVQKAGIEVINRQYAKDKHQKRLFTKIQELSQNLTKHRSQNFIGSLLQHQTHAATKYMGKWIEEKNNR